MKASKSPHNLILASEQILNFIKYEIVLLFAGNFEDSYRNEFYQYKKRVENKIRIIEIPMMKNAELAGIYSGSDIAAWPSEPTVSMIEASSSGLPVIGCDYLAERYKNNNGIGVNKESIKELSDAILFLVNNPSLRKEMGRNGRELVEKELSWKIIAQKFLEIK
jgi:glycosyltransferase involved in cell wall biosynthesis